MTTEYDLKLVVVTPEQERLLGDAGATLSHVAHLTGRDEHHAQGKALGNLLRNLQFSSTPYRLLAPTEQTETTEAPA